MECLQTEQLLHKKGLCLPRVWIISRRCPSTGSGCQVPLGLFTTSGRGLNCSSCLPWISDVLLLSHDKQNVYNHAGSWGGAGRGLQHTLPLYPGLSASAWNFCLVLLEVPPLRPDRPDAICSVPLTLVILWPSGSLSARSLAGTHGCFHICTPPVWDLRYLEKTPAMPFVPRRNSPRSATCWHFTRSGFFSTAVFVTLLQKSQWH